MTFKESSILDSKDPQGPHGLWLIAFNNSMMVYTKISIRPVTKKEDIVARQLAVEHANDHDAYARAFNELIMQRVKEAIKGLQWNADKPVVPYAFFTA